MGTLDTDGTAEGDASGVVVGKVARGVGDVRGDVVGKVARAVGDTVSTIDDEDVTDT